MNSNKTLKKYIKCTFDESVEVNYTSSFTATIELVDGTIELLALNNTITVFINGKEFQTVILIEDKFTLVW